MIAIPAKIQTDFVRASNIQNSMGVKETSGTRFEVMEAMPSLPSSERGNSPMKRVRSPHGAHETQQRAARKMEQVVAYIMEHLTQPMKISALSKLAGMSASMLFVSFKRATGLSPIDYLIRMRMQRASELLVRESTLNVKQIAGMLGYEDPYYFSRQFRSVHGMPPTKYRHRRSERTAN